MSDDPKWPSDWTRAVLAPCILQLVQARNETYGYQLVQDLGTRGLPGIVGGTVYPVLNRLETEGRLRSEWREGNGGPGRKFYSITPEGEAWLRETAESWQDFTARVAAVLTMEGNPA
jgi:PadR family transcriptional regulator PadR